MADFDAIVIGAGGVGSAVLYELARRDVSVLTIDQFAGAHDRGSSHGKSRIFRTAYFEHPDYVPLLLRAGEFWENLEQEAGQSLLRRCGLLQVGNAEGEVISGVLDSARRFQLPVEDLSPAEITRRFPGFVVGQNMRGAFESTAGYLLVEKCIEVCQSLATRRGAQIQSDVKVTGWKLFPSHIQVHTERDDYTCQKLIVTAGAWAGGLLRDLGVPLRVLRKPLYWYASDGPEFREDRGYPAFLFEVDDDDGDGDDGDGDDGDGEVFYGFPQIDAAGVKLARHSGGMEVVDPLNLNRDVDRADQKLVERFLSDHLPSVERRMTDHAVCMYTMTPDSHFIIDRHPQDHRVLFAAGLSGHGYKFAGVLGEALADLAEHGKTQLPIEFLSVDRPALRDL